LIEWPLKESDFNLNQFITELNGVLSSFERPKKLYLLPEFIETSNGKIQRKETKASIKGKTGYVL
jgi:non-ribosomal peptide synthetase component E (peptide arylation enzyme)